MRSPLGSVAGPHASDAASVRKMAAKAYHEEGVVLISPSWLATATDRVALTKLADKVHGKRKSGV